MFGSSGVFHPYERVLDANTGGSDNDSAYSWLRAPLGRPAAPTGSAGSRRITPASGLAPSISMSGSRGGLSGGGKHSVTKGGEVRCAWLSLGRALGLARSLTLFLAFSACAGGDNSNTTPTNPASTTPTNSAPPSPPSITLGGTYTVKASGGDFSTIQDCSNVAVAGDTCQVYAGTYVGWTQTTSGTPGNPITFTVNTGDIVTVTSRITLTNTKFITVNGFHVTLTTDRAFFAADDTGSGITTSDLTLTNNAITSVTSNLGECFYVYGDRTRIEGNDCSGGGNDFADLGGTNVVVRNNTFHDVDGSITGLHIDFVQCVGGGTIPTLTFSLVENNVERNCLNDAGDCHFVIIRTGASPIADTIIVRYNYAQNLDGSGASWGGLDDNVPNSRLYNNTFAAFNTALGDANCSSYQNAPNSVAMNNICYNTDSGGGFPFGGSSPPNSGNLAFTTGYTGTWDPPYSQEATYPLLNNQDPNFANYPTDGTLQAGSPAIRGGVALTNVASGDSGDGTTLIVNDAHLFQSGWAGTQADWMRVGSTTIVQIASIDYTTNTITLASPISRSIGDPVYLYKDSSGRVVLMGMAPDVGAYPF